MNEPNVDRASEATTTPPPAGPTERAWVRNLLDPEAYAALTGGLPASALWSLLLDVFAERAHKRAPPDVLRQYERDGFTRPASIDQRTLVALDAQLLSSAQEFEAIELSPLTPLATCSAVAPASQRKIVSALRGTEVVGDPTNVLALEAARRLRADGSRLVHLATCHRCVRAQAVPDQPGFEPHFRIFCLASAGRLQKDRAFLVDALARHVTTHLQALAQLETHGYELGPREVTVRSTATNDPLADRIAAAIEGVSVVRDRLAHGYYDGLRFTIDVPGTSGMPVPLADGGAFDWVARLTSNRKLAFVASGMGTQLVAYLFRQPHASP